MRARTIAGALAAVLWTAAAAPAQANDPRVPMPPRVNVERTPCPDYSEGEVLGCADVDAATIYVRPGAGPSVYWHELGHLFDDQVLTDAQRARFQVLARSPGPWWGDASATVDDGELDPTYSPPAERFAGAYSMCAMQHTGRTLYDADTVTWTADGRKLPDHVWGDYGYRGSWRRHQRVCQLIWNAAGRHYAPVQLPRWRRSR